MTHEEAVRDRISYWDERAKDALIAADYAHNQLKMAVEELAALGGLAMGETPPHLTLIQGGLNA